MGRGRWRNAAGHLVLTMLAGWMTREQQQVIAYLREENRVLRELLGSRRPRFTQQQRDRLGILAHGLKRAVLLELDTLVTPDSLRRFFRDWAARKYDSSNKRRPGRPRKSQELRDLVVRLATENDGWGLTKIRDVIGHLGHEIGRTTVRRILDVHGMHPAPERLKHMPWETFLRAHWGAIVAMDFFYVEVLTLLGPVRYAVLFVIDLKSRAVQVAGIVREPYEEWMVQMARNLTDAVAGFLLGKTHLIIDRDPNFTRDFRDMLRSCGVTTVRLPSRSPNLNAFAERFVRSIKEECLERVVPLGEAHLRELAREYMQHYQHERPHQGLEGQLIEPRGVRGTGSIRRHQRLGGLLNHYERQAA